MTSEQSVWIMNVGDTGARQTHGWPMVIANRIVAKQNRYEKHRKVKLLAGGIKVVRTKTARTGVVKRKVRWLMFMIAAAIVSIMASTGAWARPASGRTGIEAIKTTEQVIQERIVKAWRDGFMAGYNLALERIADILRKHSQLLDAITTWKQLLIAGEVPPVVIKVKFDVKKNEDGSYSVVRRIVFTPVKPEDLKDATVIKNLFEEKLAEVGDSELVGTYWAYKDVRNEPLKNIATYQFIARKAGYTPFIRDEKLVFGVFDRIADAKYAAKRLRDLGIPHVIAAPSGKGEAYLVFKEYAEQEKGAMETPSRLTKIRKGKQKKKELNDAVQELFDDNPDEEAYY